MMNPPNHRRSIRQSTPATRRLSPQWKDALKRNCMERARKNRDGRIAKSRASPNMACSTPGSVYNLQASVQSTPQMRGTATNLIQEHLHATGITILPSPSTYAVNTFSTPTNGIHVQHSPHPSPAPGLPRFSHSSTCGTGSNTNLFPEPNRDGNYITEEEFYALIDEIEEELQNDYEVLLAEQMQVLQEEEEKNQSMIEEQIESYERYGY